ncbi:MAG: hypothetical protein LBL54_00290 [Clostridiales Family XIII bacterium]|jgi:flagellar biogenesis protein FliO|nr:hypothetical protein [Clostridiales Family XIII bacterium]
MSLAFAGTTFILLAIWIAIIVLAIWLIVKIVKAFRAHFERVAHIESTLVAISEQLDQMSRKRAD